MSDQLVTVEHAAERLRVHARTVLRFIRDGRLRATRIGKAWRIGASELERFAGGASATPIPAAPRATAVVDFSDVTVERSARLASAMQSLALAGDRRAQPLTLDTVYDPARAHLKVIMVGDLGEITAMLQSLQTFAAALA